MGCSGSKSKGPGASDPSESALAVDGAKPDALRKEITELYKTYCEQRDLLKPLIKEKVGLQAMLDEEREKMMVLEARKESLEKEREPLLIYTWERDADEIYRAFGKFSLDKDILISILINRTKWQLKAIAETFERKYGRPLLQFVVSEMQTTLGKLATGGTTGLSKLLTYRIMDQPERDAAFLRDFTSGMGLDDENLIEIVCTRSNLELRFAIDAFQREYGKSLADIVRSKASYKNYKEFMLAILECNRDENNRPFDAETAESYANELFNAGAGRTIPDAEPFIRILSKVNNIQFESINAKYRSQQLVKDITAKFGGDFAMAMLARIADKYEFLANKIDKALKGFKADKEILCRILGSLSRMECSKLRDAFDRIFPGKTLESTLKQSIAKGHFQTACIELISTDLSLTPLGSDREIGEDEDECSREGDRAKNVAMVNYRTDKTMHRGEQILAARRRGRGAGLNTSLENNSNHITNNNNSVNINDIQLNNNNNSNNINNNNNNNNNDSSIDDEYDMPQYSWDMMRGRFMDNTRLTKELKDCQEATKAMKMMRERVADEIDMNKDIYFSIVKHGIETESWIRILTNQLKNLNDFIARRDRSAANASGSKKKGNMTPNK